MREITKKVLDTLEIVLVPTSLIRRVHSSMQEEFKVRDRFLESKGMHVGRSRALCAIEMGLEYLGAIAGEIGRGYIYYQLASKLI